MIIEERWSIIKGDFSFFFLENRHTLEKNTFLLFPWLSYYHHSSCLTLDVWVFHTAGISATPNVGPTIQLSSDIVCLEVASLSLREGFSFTRLSQLKAPMAHLRLSSDGKKVKVKVAQLCPALCDPMDYSLWKWVAFPFSRGSSQPRDWTQVSCIAADSLLAESWGQPVFWWTGL